MKSKKLPTILNRCEIVIAYFCLSVVVALKFLNMIAPTFIQFLKIDSTDFSLCLISASLLVIFNHIEDIKKDTSKSSLANVSTSFNDGLLWVFEKNKNKIKTLDIMAHTTKTYVQWIAYNDIIIESVRLLVCRPKSSATRHYPDEPQTCVDIDRDRAIQQWKDMQRNGKITNLEIRYYEYDPTYFFAVINDQYVHHGIYKIEHDNPGYHLYTLYTLDSSDSELAYKTLIDYQSFFNHVYSNFSYSDLDEIMNFQKKFNY